MAALDDGSGALAEAFEACEIIERAVVVRAVDRRTAADLIGLHAVLDTMHAVDGDPHAFVACDLVLRERIATASRSRHLAAALGVLHGALADTLVRVARSDARDRRTDGQLAVRVALVDAVERNDQTGARHAIDLALAHVRPRLPMTSGTACVRPSLLGVGLLPAPAGP